MYWDGVCSFGMVRTGTSSSGRHSHAGWTTAGPARAYLLSSLTDGRALFICQSWKHHEYVVVSEYGFAYHRWFRCTKGESRHRLLFILLVIYGFWGSQPEPNVVAPSILHALGRIERRTITCTNEHDFQLLYQEIRLSEHHAWIMSSCTHFARVCVCFVFPGSRGSSQSVLVLVDACLHFQHHPTNTTQSVA